MITNQNQWKNSDQVSCPGSIGKEKWMKLTGPVTIIPIFSLGLLLEKKVHHAVRLASTFWKISYKVVTDHVLALASFSYINKYSKTKIPAFCCWNNQLVIWLRAVQFKGTPWTVLHSVLLPLPIEVIIPISSSPSESPRPLSTSRAMSIIICT